MLSHGNASSDHCASTREHDLSTEVIVTHFWSDLSITVVRVDGNGVIIVVRVRGQVFGREILNR